MRNEIKKETAELELKFGFYKFNLKFFKLKVFEILRNLKLSTGF